MTPSYAPAKTYVREPLNVSDSRPAFYFFFVLIFLSECCVDSSLFNWPGYSPDSACRKRIKLQSWWMHNGGIHFGGTLLSTCGSNENRKHVQTQVSYISQPHHQGKHQWKYSTLVDPVLHVPLEHITRFRCMR